jgi:hypothetical protein
VRRPGPFEPTGAAGRARVLGEREGESEIVGRGRTGLLAPSPKPSPSPSTGVALQTMSSMSSCARVGRARSSSRALRCSSRAVDRAGEDVSSGSSSTGSADGCSPSPAGKRLPKPKRRPRPLNMWATWAKWTLRLPALPLRPGSCLSVTKDRAPDNVKKGSGPRNRTRRPHPWRLCA